MARHLGQHTIVIGGSMTRLMTARVLADYFARVTIQEWLPPPYSSTRCNRCLRR
jgi:hypothetical protein